MGDDVFHRTPPNVASLNFKTKALRIIKEIKQCQQWIKPFREPVDEQKENASNYYKIIKNPMDIGSLKHLIESNVVTTSKDFASKLMSIWSNAMLFNPKQHKIHQYAIKCKIESIRLLEKYKMRKKNVENQKNKSLIDGLWIDLCFDAEDLWFEAIVCHQTENRIFYRLVYSTSMSDTTQCPQTAATIISHNPMVFELDKKKRYSFSRGQLEGNNDILRFIDIEDENNSNLYKKVSIKCNACHSEMVFMRKQTLPSNASPDHGIFCDVHNEYYQKNECMEPQLRCSSFSAFKYDVSSKNRIQDIAFYFTCVQCEEFDICGGCILIKMEQEFKQKNKIFDDHKMDIQHTENAQNAKERVVSKQKKVKSKVVAKKMLNENMEEEYDETMENINIHKNGKTKSVAKRRRIKSKVITKKNKE